MAQLLEGCEGCAWTANKCKKHINTGENPMKFCDPEDSSLGCTQFDCPTYCSLTDELLNENYLNLDGITRASIFSSGYENLSDFRKNINELTADDQSTLMTQRNVLKAVTFSDLYKGTFELSTYADANTDLKEKQLSPECIDYINDSTDNNITNCNDADKTIIADYLKAKVKFPCGDDEYDYKKNMNDTNLNFQYPEAPTEATFINLFSNQYEFEISLIIIYYI